MFLDCGEGAQYIARPLCRECWDERWRADLCAECGAESAKFELIPASDDGPAVKFCLQCWRRLLAPPRCDECGRFVSPRRIAYLPVGRYRLGPYDSPSECSVQMCPACAAKHGAGLEEDDGGLHK